MKILDTSAVSTTNGLPLKSGSINHIQSAYTEVVAEMVKNAIGDSYSASTPYILEGMALNAGATAVTAGSLFWNGEIFLVDAFSVPSPANAGIDTTFVTAIDADPVDFTDGTPRSIHQIRKISFVSGTPTNPAGFVLSQCVRIGEIPVTAGLPTTVTFEQDRAYFRSFIANPGSTFSITFSATGAVNGKEVWLFLQSDGNPIAMTVNLSGFTHRMGIGGFANPTNISVASGGYCVIKFTAVLLRQNFISVGAAAMSIEILESN